MGCLVISLILFRELQRVLFTVMALFAVALAVSAVVLAVVALTLASLAVLIPLVA
jgi:hypothetical protein